MNEQPNLQGLDSYLELIEIASRRRLASAAPSLERISPQAQKEEMTNAARFLAQIQPKETQEEIADLNLVSVIAGLAESDKELKFPNRQEFEKWLNAKKTEIMEDIKLPKQVSGVVDYAGLFILQSAPHSPAAWQAAASILTATGPRQQFLEHYIKLCPDNDCALAAIHLTKMAHEGFDIPLLNIKAGDAIKYILAKNLLPGLQQKREGVCKGLDEAEKKYDSEFASRLIAAFNYDWPVNLQEKSKAIKQAVETNPKSVPHDMESLLEFYCAELKHANDAVMQELDEIISQIKAHTGGTTGIRARVYGYLRPSVGKESERQAKSLAANIVDKFIQWAIALNSNTPINSMAEVLVDSKVKVGDNVTVAAERNHYQMGGNTNNVPNGSAGTVSKIKVVNDKELFVLQLDNKNLGRAGRWIAVRSEIQKSCSAYLSADAAELACVEIEKLRRQAQQSTEETLLQRAQGQAKGPIYNLRNAATIAVLDALRSNEYQNIIEAARRAAQQYIGTGCGGVNTLNILLSNGAKYLVKKNGIFINSQMDNKLSSMRRERDALESKINKMCRYAESVDGFNKSTI